MNTTRPVIIKPNLAVTAHDLTFSAQKPSLKKGSDKTLQGNSKVIKKRSINTSESLGDESYQETVLKNKELEALLIQHHYLPPTTKLDYSLIDDNFILVNKGIEVVLHHKGGRSIILKKFNENEKEFYDWISKNIFDQSLSALILQKEIEFKRHIYFGEMKEIVASYLNKISNNLLTLNSKNYIHRVFNDYVKKQNNKRQEIINFCKLLPDEAADIRRQVENLDNRHSSEKVKKIDIENQELNGNGQLFSKFSAGHLSSKSELYNFVVYNDYTFIPVKKIVNPEKGIQYVTYNKDHKGQQTSYPIRLIENAFLILTNEPIDSIFDHSNPSSIVTAKLKTTKPTSSSTHDFSSSTLTAEITSQETDNTTRKTTVKSTGSTSASTTPSAEKYTKENKLSVAPLLTFQKPDIFVANQRVTINNDTLSGFENNTPLLELRSTDNAVITALQDAGFYRTNDFYSDFLVNHAIEFVNLQEDGSKIIAHEILKNAGYYFGTKNESLSKNYSDTVFHNWVIHKLFGNKNIEEFFIQQIFYTSNDENIFTDSISKKENLFYISTKISRKVYEKTKNNDVAMYIIKKIILPEFPILPYGFIRVDSDDFFYCNAGLLFLRAIGYLSNNENDTNMRRC